METRQFGRKKSSAKQKLEDTFKQFSGFNTDERMDVTIIFTRKNPNGVNVRLISSDISEMKDPEKQCMEEARERAEELMEENSDYVSYKLLLGDKTSEVEEFLKNETEK